MQAGRESRRKMKGNTEALTLVQMSSEPKEKQESGSQRGKNKKTADKQTNKPPRFVENLL